MKKSFGLGRGLESLIPTKQSTKVSPKIQENVFNVEIHKIKPNPHQPRHDFDKESLTELASSIKKYGILQPLLVSKVEHETERGLEVTYELIAGERRLRAAQMANLPYVPVIIKDNFDEDKVKLEVALIENIQRQNLNPIEEAEAYVKLANEFDLSQVAIAERVGKSRPVVANTMRLLELPAEIKEALRSGKISYTHGRNLLSFKDATKQKEFFKQILAGTVGSKDIEAAAHNYNAVVNPTILKEKKANPRFMQLEQNLAKTLATPVVIKSAKSGGENPAGSIIIKFKDLEELNTIAKTILD